MTNEPAALDIYRHHARKAEAAALNALNCRILSTGDAHGRWRKAVGESIVRELDQDATRYALEAQMHAAIARTVRDGFTPVIAKPRTVRTTHQATPAAIADLAQRFDQVGAL